MVPIVAMRLRAGRVGRTAGEQQRGGQGEDGLVHEAFPFMQRLPVAGEHHERGRLIAALLLPHRSATTSPCRSDAVATTTPRQPTSRDCVAPTKARARSCRSDAVATAAPRSPT